MAKASNKTGGSITATLTKDSNPMVTSKSYRPKSSTGTAGKGGCINKTVSLTHEQVEERAKLIWRQNGCPSGQDQKNWYEAEAQLKRELGIE